ncbi:MAG: sugar phosphate isomerase/epimerase family protein [Pirellulales bacterium]
MFKNLNPAVLGVAGHQSEIIEAALSFGFRNIDLDIVDFSGRVAAQGMPYARRLLDSAKLHITGFRLPVALAAEDAQFVQDLAALPKLAQMAADLNCTRAYATIAPANDLRPYHENYEVHRQRLGQVCEALAPFGIRLGLEFLASTALQKDFAFQFIHDVDALVLLVSMVPASNLGLVLDLWNLYVSGGALENLADSVLRQAVAVQVADAPLDVPLEQLTEESRLLPGETGRIDTAAALARLAAAGYQGPVTPAPHKSQFRGTRRDAIVKRVAAALDTAWKAAGLAPSGKPAAAVGRP